MDLTREYNNANLERKRLKLLYQQKAASLLAQSKATRSNAKDAIRIAFEGDRNDDNATKSSLATSIRLSNKTLNGAYRDAFHKLLSVVERETCLLDYPNKFIRPLADLANWSLFWVNSPDTWKSKSYNEERDFSYLARHLLARYEVPLFMDHCWFSEAEYQEWFIHIGQGQNIRKASHLPVVLTKMQSHCFLQATKEYTITEALRYGQIRGIGGEERLVDAIIATRLGRGFGREEFWATVIQWFVQNQTMDMRQVGPIIDYIDNQRHQDAGNIWVGGDFVWHGPPQPNFSMKGRTADALVRQVEEWHKRLAKSRSRKIISWQSCGIPGMDKIEGEGKNKRQFLITELLSSGELNSEGKAMHHCVASYAYSCSSKRCAIYSLQINDGGGLARRLTIEVDLQSRTVVQAKGQCNAILTELDKRILRAWTIQNNLRIGRYV